MNHDQKDLMLYLANRLEDLEKIPATHRPQFDMQHWKGKRWDGVKCEGDCDTAVCAMGLAAMDPKFQAAGLRLVPASNLTVPDAPAHVCFRNWSGFTGVAYFFGIAPHDAVHAFSKDAYLSYLDETIKPSEVARRIRDIVKRYLP